MMKFVQPLKERKNLRALQKNNLLLLRFSAPRFLKHLSSKLACVNANV